MAARLIARTNIKKVYGRLYYVKANEEGNLCIYMADVSYKQKKLTKEEISH